MLARVRRLSPAGDALAEAGPLTRALCATLVVAAAGSLLAAAALRGGGSDDTTLPWIGGAASVVVGVLLVGALLDLWPMPVPSRIALAGLALFVALIAWTGLSVLWSIAPDLSWSYFNRGVTYAALLGLGLFFGALVRRAPSVFASAAALVIATALVWALAGKVDPSLFEDGARRVRLREPVGIWNLLAVLLASGVPLSLWLTARRNPLPVRALGTGFLLLLVPALALTLSRSGIIVAVLGVLLWLAFAPGRLESVVVILLALPAGLGLARWAIDRPGLAEEGQSLAQRASDGRQLGIYLAVGFAAAVAAAWSAFALERAWPLHQRLRARLNVAVGLIAALAVSVALVVFFARVGSPISWAEAKLDEATSDVLVGDDASRLTSASLNARWDWWKEAARAAADEPVLGHGAGSFPIVHRIYRDDELNVLEPHNVPLQFLAETGAVGFALFLASALALLAAALRAYRRVDERDRGAALAMLVALAIYAVHSLVEVDWDFVAVSGPALLGLGVLLGTNRARDSGHLPGTLALPVALLAGLCVVSLVLPPLAVRSVTRSASQLLDDPAGALDEARHAGRLNPHSLAPLFAQADAQFVLGRPSAARSLYVTATERHPKNSDSWLALADFELASGRVEAAVAAINRAVELDPFSRRVRLTRDEVERALRSAAE